MVYFKKLNILILKANSIFTLSSFYLVLWNWRTISISFYFIMLMIKEFTMNIQPFWIQVSWTLLCNNINVQYKMLNFFLILNTISIMFKNRSLDQQKKKFTLHHSMIGLLLTIFDLWHPAEYREPHQTLRSRVRHHHIQKVVHIDRSILSETKGE